MTAPRLVLLPGTTISDRERASRLLGLARDTARQLADLAHPDLHPGDQAGMFALLMAAAHDYDGLTDGTLAPDQAYPGLTGPGDLRDVAIERAWDAVREHIWSLTHETGEAR